MLDCHIHIERGEYTLDWINEFVKTAVSNGLDEIWLLEHCYRFREFVPMYDSIHRDIEYVFKWFFRRAGVLGLDDYLCLIDSVRSSEWPVKIKFGLEVCYFKKYEEFVYNQTKNKELDFLVGSVHFIDFGINDRVFAFDHKPEFWDGIDVDEAYRRYFETSIDLVESGIYSGIAHPDCIKLFGHKPSFSLDTYFEKIANVLAKNGMYAEQNSGSYRRCPDTSELGMNAGFINVLKRNDAKIQTASDAHCPKDVGLYIKELEALI